MGQGGVGDGVQVWACGERQRSCLDIGEVLFCMLVTDSDSSI